MALLKYSDYFDFEGMKNALKDLEGANKDFGAAIEGTTKRISSSYKEVQGELKALADVLRLFNVNQRGAGEQLASVGVQVEGLTKKQQEQKRVMQELNATADLTTRSLNEIKIAAKGVEKEYSSLAGRSDDVKAKQKALADEYGRLTIAAKQQAQVLKVTAKVVDASENSYQRLQLELSQVGKELKSLSNAFDPVSGKINESNKEAVALQKRYLELNNALKTADSALGNYQRNVGNYANATHSLSQILREFPAFAINAQTGILALSNNLPILFDQFAKVKNETGSTGQALKIFGQSLFSVGNLLTIGVTLLTVYGKEIGEFVGDLLKGKKSFDALAESQKLWNEAVKEANKTAATEINDLKFLYNAATDVNSSMEERLKAVKKLKDEFPEYFKDIDNETILNGKAKKSYQDLRAEIIKTAKARAAKGKIDELTAQQLDIEFEKDKINTQFDNDFKNAKASTASTGAGNSFAMGASTQTTTTTKEEEQKLIEFRRKKALEEKEINRQRLQQQIDFLVKFAEGEKEITKTIIDDGKKGPKGKSEEQLLSERIKKAQDLLKSASDLDIQSLELQLEQKLISQEEFEIKKLGIIKEYTDAAVQLEKRKGKNADGSTINDLNSEKLKAEADYQKNVRAIVESNRKEDLESAKKRIEDEAADKVQSIKNEQSVVLSTKQFTDKEREALEIDYQNRVDEILIESLNRRIVLETDAAKKSALERQKQELENGINNRNSSFSQKSIQDRYDAEIRAQKTAFDIIRAGRDTSFKEELEYLERLKSIKTRYAKDTAEEELAIKQLYAERERSIEEEKNKLIGEGFQAALGITQNLLNGSFENRIYQIEEEKKRALEAAGNNAQAKEKIEKEYNKKIAAEKTKQAKADRAFALFNVAISTGQGIMKSIAQWGMPFALPFIAMTAISGALQAALILSKPIPKYKTGRKGGGSEMAIVDEAGPELIIDKHGKLKEVGGTGGDRLTWLDSGDKVLTHDESKRFLKGKGASDILNEMSISRRASANIRDGKQSESVMIMAKAMQLGGMNTRSIEKAFKSAVKDIPLHQTIIDEKGQRERIKRANDTTTYLNNQSKF